VPGSASNIELKTGSTEVVTLTVLVKDAGNAAVANAPVQFSATGGVLSAATATTDATGVARVTLSAGDDLTNKLLTVTTKVGTLAPVTSSINLIGTALSIGGPSGTVAGRATNYVITLKDAAGNPLPNKPITVSASGATVTPASGTTGSTGQLNISLQPNSGVATAQLNVAALGASASYPVSVSNAQLQFTSPAADATVATTSEGCQPVVFVGSSTSPTANFGVSRGKLYSNPSCTTELSASQTVNLTPSGATASTTLYAASTAPGTAIITATSGGGSTSLNLRYVATVPASLVTQASPSVVAPGAGVTVQAIVKDVAGNPVEGKTVFFSVPTGNGSVSPVSATTDATGTAISSFTAGSAPSAQNGVTVKSTVAGLAETAAQSTALTISSTAISIAMGSDGAITTVGPSSSYQVRYTATLSDSSGAPLANQKITFSRLYTKYYKGSYRKLASAVTTETGWQKQSNATCIAEDTNGDGTLNSGEHDQNTNNLIEPNGDARLSSASGAPASGSQTTLTTDADGSATVYVSYLQSYASWVEIKLQASTGMVSGPNSVTSRVFTLPAPSAVLQDTENTPPFVTSPFGVVSECSNPG
jgi:hypothetical protein